MTAEMAVEMVVAKVVEDGGGGDGGDGGGGDGGGGDGAEVMVEVETVEATVEGTAGRRWRWGKGAGRGRRWRRVRR